MSDFIKGITDTDVEKIGLKIFRRDENDDASYIQICDSERIFDDEKYTCHYEILHMKKQDISVNHQDDCVYVEIHFENITYSKYLKTTVENLVNNDDELESFSWRIYCPGLRLKNSQFTTKEKKKVLKTLKQLKEKTLNVLIKEYNNIIHSINNTKWSSDFKLRGSIKNTSSKSKTLTEYNRDKNEIVIIHEQIKEKLIKDIRDNPELLETGCEIDISTLSDENEINKINYVDLAAQTKDKQIIFFEIKTVPDTRLCIRQALGQLMEYSYFPKVKNAQKLIVVGTGEKTQEVQEYIDYLNKDFNIPIDYLQINM